MKFIAAFAIFSLFAILTGKSKNPAPDYLLGCWVKQVKPIYSRYIELKYKESANRLYHSFEPWQLINTKTGGTILINKSYFYKNDSLKTPKHIYKSQTQFDNKTLLYMNLGDTTLSKVSHNDYLEEPIEILRYSPVFIIDKFKHDRVQPSKIDADSFMLYEMKINQAIVKLFIRKSDSLAVKITTLENDDLYGDVLNTYFYTDFAKTNQISMAKSIYIEKTNHKVLDTVKISSVVFVKKKGQVIAKPKDYQMQDEVPPKPDFTIDQYNENIHLINMKHTDDKVMIVEFKDFMLCSEAPLNSENGELIIHEAQKIVPNKPIKYFVFCHFHSHYIGGIRAFVHKGATILTPAVDSSYVRWLVENPHTAKSDSLQLERRDLKMEKIQDSLIVTDGSYVMKIYLIGKKSKHTNDYLIYYFPKEKMVFEGDLVWINKKNPTKAGSREIGLYSSIKDLKLDVSTILQSWPVNNYNVKTVIPFKELEESVNQK